MTTHHLRRPRTWRGRLLLAFVGLLVPVSLWEAYDLRQQFSRQEAEALEAQVQTAQALATGLEAVMNDLRHNLALVAHQFETDSLTRQAARETLAAVRPLVWPADLVSLVDADGTVVAAVPDEGRIGWKLGGDSYAAAVLRDHARWGISPLLEGAHSGRLGFAMLHDIEGPRRGAVLGWLDATTVGLALGHVTPPPDTVFAILDNEGHVVYHSRYPDLPRPARDWSRSPYVEEALAGRVARVPRLVGPSDGEIRMGATVPVPGVGWAIGVFRSRDAALAPVLAAMRRGLVQAGLMGMLLAGVAWLLATRIARPVHALRAGAEALGAGRLDVRVPEGPPDELGRLGHAFNAMAERLGRQVADLEAARAAAEAAERRSAFLAEASTLLGASLDYEATLGALARLAVPVLADWCMVDALDAGGRIVRIARAHRDPSRLEEGEAFERLYPARPDDVRGPAAVIRTGVSEFVPEIGDDLLEATVPDDEKRRRLRAFRLCSYLCVPLRARDRVFGALTLVMAESGRRHAPADLAFAEDLARRAALFVDNARLLREAQAAAQEARDAVRARDAFLARASHELRTPLTSALGTVRLIGRAMTGSLPERPEPLLEIAMRNLTSMAALINDLLDASKLAAGREAIAREPIPVAGLVAASAEMLAAEARERRVGVERRVPEGLVLVGDRLKLEQVLVNLLANAVKFTPAGGRIVVEAEATDGAIVLGVHDTGEGIAREHLERIFEPFFQTGGRSQRRSRGTGLGLAICRQIVTLHGGTIHAESGGPGQGSRFVVRLPARAAEDRAA